MKNLHMIAHIILVVMGINVGLSLLGLDVVGMVLGVVPILLTIWAILVAASGIYCAYMMITGKCHK